MNAIEFLKRQHREVESLFKRIESLGDKAGREKKQIFDEIYEKLDTHARIEEKIFYPEGREADEDMTLEAYEEHDIVRTLLKKIAKTLPSDETFMAKVTVLKEVVQHHVEEEEEEYFPECEKELGEERLAEIGEELEAATEKAESKNPVARKKVRKRAA